MDIAVQSRQHINGWWLGRCYGLGVPNKMGQLLPTRCTLPSIVAAAGVRCSPHRPLATEDEGDRRERCPLLAVAGDEDAARLSPLARPLAAAGRED
ncbi:hypothetical protein ACLOJK_019551 [Asimina triloba]